MRVRDQQLKLKTDVLLTKEAATRKLEYHLEL